MLKCTFAVIRIPSNFRGLIQALSLELVLVEQSFIVSLSNLANKPIYSNFLFGWNGWRTIVKSVHFGSQVAGMPCQNNHFWLHFGYRDV